MIPSVVKQEPLTADLTRLVKSGTVTLKQAQDMMPKRLTADLNRMVDEGVITHAQALRLMSESQPAPALIEHFGKMISKGVITGKEAGEMMVKVQEHGKQCVQQHGHQKYILDHKLEEDPLLKTSWPSRAQAIDHIKYHSTRQGKQVLVNRKSSGSRKIVLMCASALHRGHPKHSECGCEYRVVLKKSKVKGCNNPWRLSKRTKSTDIQHCVTCTSSGRLSYREAILNLKTIETQKLPSIQQTLERIARDNKVAHASVSPHVAQKVRLAEAKNNFADYFANWSKLDEWSREFKKLNPESVVDVDADKNVRFRRMFVGIRSAGWVAKHAGKHQTMCNRSRHPGR